MVRYVRPRSLCSLRVVLHPGLNLYPSFSSLSSPSVAVLCGARVLVAGMYVGRLLPLWCVRSCAWLAACSVRGRFVPCLCCAFLSFSFVLVRSFLLPRLCRFFLSFSLLSFFRPRAALPVGMPWVPGEP